MKLTKFNEHPTSENLKDLTLLLEILKIPEKRLRELLEGRELKAYDFALYYRSNRGEDLWN